MIQYRRIAYHAIPKGFKPFLFCFFFIPIVAAVGQTRQMKFDHLTVEHGLSSLTPFHIVQDKQGFLWIGTEDGLNRYDGYTFVVYRADPKDSTTLSRGLCTGLSVTPDGNLWVSTETDILHCYDPDTDSFVRHKIVVPPEIKIDYRLSLGHIKPEGDSTLWIATNAGLCKFNTKTFESRFFTHDTADSSTLSMNAIRTLCLEGNDFIWISSSNGLNLFDKRNEKVRRFQLNVPPFKPGHNDVHDVAVDAEGTVWAATFSGLLRLERRTGSFIPFRQKTSKGPDLGTEVFVNTVYVDDKGIVWVGTFRDGLFRYDPSSGRFSQHLHDAANPRSLNDDRITCIIQDRSDVLWIGTYRVGLNKYDRRRDQYAHYPANRGVFAIREDSFGNVWTGMFGTGIRIYEKQSGVMREFPPNPSKPGGLRGPEIYSFAEDRSGDMWIATNLGIERYDRTTKHFRQHELNKFLRRAAYPTIKCLLIDNDGELWAGTFAPSLLRYNPKNGAVSEYKHEPGNPNSLIPGEIWTLYEDRAGRIWAGSFSGGVSMIDKKTNAFTSFRHNEDDPTSLPVHGVYAITQDEEGVFWLGGVGGGLMRFDSESGIYKQYTVRDGLADNFVKTVIADAKGNLWLGTDKGISLFDKKLEVFKNLKEKDGLLGNVFLSGSAFRSPSGMLYFGGEGGVTAFHPDSLKPKEYKPPVVLTSFKVFEKPFPLERSIMYLSGISLKHDEHTFSFEFVALDYSLPERNEYAYKLEGLDTGWTHAGTRRYASYTHIPPGLYTFRVRGSNSDGVWNEEGTSMRLVIEPPYWETWWFRIAAVILLAGLGAAIYNYRVNRLLEIERLRVRIASDLHDDIGSSLTKISLQSELIQEGFEPEERENYLTNIATMSRELVTSMSDIVWSIDARNDTIESVLDKMKSFASSTLAAKDIGFSFAHSGLDLKKKIPVDVRENLYLIFKETINNIAKHADASHVNVVLRNDADGFSMIVVDDGKGWEGTARPSGHGTKNMRMRAERLGGTIDFVKDEGTRVVLKVRKL
ncbi:MAG: hypothetical protein KF749_00915 [Bacteroidetes bacterium]|nr:hypothetical protein [Bacteroidota bacterium]MCW5895190.1 hypothetical protein [Bacteroidota bacterium]